MAKSAKKAPAKKKTVAKTSGKKATPAKAAKPPKSSVKKAAKKTTAEKTVAGKKNVVSKKPVASKKLSTSKKTVAEKPAAPKKAAKKTVKKVSARTTAAKKPAQSTAAAAQKKAATKAAKARSNPNKTAAKKVPKKPAGKKPITKKPELSADEVDVKASAVDSSAAAPTVGSGLSFLAGKPGSDGAADDAFADKPRLEKTKLSEKDLEKFRQLLSTHRRQLLGDIDAMEKEALQSDGANLSTLPVHMADVGTDMYEQEFTLSLADRARRVIEEIDHALSKIDDQTYGICEGTGQMIAKQRLEARPWTRYSIEYARRNERRSGGKR